MIDSMIRICKERRLTNSVARKKKIFYNIKLVRWINDKISAESG